MGFFSRTLARVFNKVLNDPVLDRGGWVPVIRESFAGAWQQNVEIDFNSVLSNHAVFACITLIASDIAKLRVKLVEFVNDEPQTEFDRSITGKRKSGIWVEIENPAYSPVLRKPNTFQNRIQFWEGWMMSKLTRGNTYALKQRDGRNVVVRLFILDPARVRPLISDDGAIFYELNTDNITGLSEKIIVPAREIIHDRMNCLFHPLVGTSPIFAAGLAATQGLAIQTDSTRFFNNMSRPSGILVAPGRIDPAHAAVLKAYWDENFAGANRGKIAVVGDGLKYQELSINAEDSQLIEQLKWSAEMICSTFHVPPYKIGVGAVPSYNNIQALNVEYYSQCLQRLIEDAEICLDEGLEMVPMIGTEFDLDGLLRMDSVTQSAVIRDGIGAGFLSPNEGRKKMDLKPVLGGETPYLQQQNYSLSALSKRDAQDDPFAKDTAAPPPANDNAVDEAAELDSLQWKALIGKAHK